MAKTRRPSRPSPSHLKTPPPVRRRRRVPARVFRRFAVGASVVITAAVVAAVAWSATRPGPRQIAPERVIASYRVVYQVQSTGAPRLRQERIVDRPYRGVEITRDASGAITTGQIFSDDAYFLYQAQNHGWAKVADKPRRPGFDYRLIPVIRELLARHDVRWLGRRHVAGRTCDLIRTGSAVGDPDVFQRPSAKHHADLCIDRTGVLLSERWVLNGKVARRTEAVEFAPGYQPLAGAFDPTPRVADLPVAAAGATIDLDASGRATFGAVVTPFGGFRDDGGIVEVKITQLGASGASATIRYRRGVDLIELSQLTSLPTRPPADYTIRRSPWGDIEVRPDPIATEYDVPLGESRFVRIRSARLDVLDAAVAHLHHVKR